MTLRMRTQLADRRNLPAKPSVNDLEMWLDYQGKTTRYPHVVEGIGSSFLVSLTWRRFAQKIRVLFYVPEVRSRMFPEEGYSAPPGPQSLNREAYLLDRLFYQDLRWQPALLTVAYCWCLQHWAEKCNLPQNPDFCPLAESVRELRQAIHEFVNITREDVMEGLKMEGPEDGHRPSPTTIFSQVLGPPANRQKAEESSTQPRDRAVECTPPTLRWEWEDHALCWSSPLQ